MELSHRERLSELVEQLTTSGQSQLNENKMKEIKKICKYVDRQRARVYVYIICVHICMCVCTSVSVSTGCLSLYPTMRLNNPAWFTRIHQTRASQSVSH